MVGGKKKWSVEQRLEFIEFRLYWEGGIQRKDLTEQFGISVPQASKDIALYRETAPENLHYDSSLKSYTASDGFVPMFFTPNPERYLAQLSAIKNGTISLDETLFSTVTAADVLSVPARSISPNILRALNCAIRSKQAIEVEYISMSKTEDDQFWRCISPHSFCSDGMRWHVRAYCHESKMFKDFVISRFLNVGGFEEQGATKHEDEDWNKFITIRIMANPELSDIQRQVIETDFGMENGRSTIKVRHAMIWYFDKIMRFDIDRDMKIPRKTPVVIENEVEYKKLLGRLR